MQMESAENGGFDRRGALRMFVGIPVGVAAAEALSFISDPVEAGIQQITGLDTGNASMNATIRQACGRQPSTSCLKVFASKGQNKSELLLNIPLAEECVFRAGPSTVLDKVTDHSDLADALKKTIMGRQHVPRSRREILTGAVTSILFGFQHNVVVSRGIKFNTNTLPVMQTIGGGVLWILQRKFGFLSNLAAHSFINFKWTRNPS